MLLHSQSNIKVLIVEDSQTQAMLLKEELEQNGIEVVIVNNGKDALEMLKIQNPSLVISDVKMPDMNGYEFCKALRLQSNFKNLPVILLTILSDPLDVIKGIECGADYFFTKPCEIHLLLSSIEDLIKNRKLSRVSGENQFLEFFWGGQRFSLQGNMQQITSLLLSTYATAIQKTRETEEVNRKLLLTDQKLREKNAELNKLNIEKNQWLGMAAHDLRNPLGVIQGYCKILLEKLSGSLDKKSENMLTLIEDSSHFMLQIINNLLDISIIESGKLRLELSKQNLEALVKKNILLNEDLAENKAIHLVFKCEENLPDIDCDSNKIGQVLNNLLSNAIKFSHSGTSIDISLSKTPNEVILAVKDQGVGIPEHEKDRLFQYFSRTSAKATDGEMSTGLGLAIVKKIVVEHQGRVWMDSKVGQGTTFWIALPYSPNEANVLI